MKALARSRVLLGAGGAACFLALWEAAGRNGWLGRTFPPLSDAIAKIGEQDDVIRLAAAATLERAAWGYLLGAALAVGLAVVALLIPRLETAAYTGSVVVHAVPAIALGPVINALGFTQQTPILFALMFVFFTILVAAGSGFASGSRSTHDVFSVLGSSKIKRFGLLQVPNAIPNVIDGLRVAAPAAVSGAVLGEWFGSERGLGVLLLNAMRNFQVEQLWAVAIVLVVLAGGAYLLLGVVERLAEQVFGRVVAVGGVHRVGGDIGWARSLVSQLWVVALLIVGWWLWIEIESVPELVAPSPLRTLAAVLDNPGLYAEHTLVTLLSAIGGLSMGLAMGTTLALLSSLSLPLRNTLSPIVVIMPTVPIVVLIPVVARLFGFSQLTVLVIAAVIAFFPVYVFTLSGLRARPPGADGVYSALGSARWRRVVLLAIPSAVPNILTGVRITASTVFLAALTAEWLMGTKGLGFLFSTSRASFENSEAWGAIVIAVVFAVVTYQLASALERWGRERWT
ncbi:MAG: ABC transporter permease subunit [Acidimicrobiaceae bacterium]|nr:ABC transporter permease subunit [Acidimicrobiaceae bacterium]